MLKTLRVVDFEILRVRQELPNTESTKVTVGNTIPFSLKWTGDQFKNSHSKLQLIKYFMARMFCAKVLPFVLPDLDL